MKSCKDKDTVSLVVTSCNRHDLLISTLESFARFNSYPIHQIIIIEDSDVLLDKNTIEEVFSKDENDCYSSTEIILLNNEVNIGQIKSIDKAYSYVTGEYIFHCEDDWRFYKEGFIEPSMQILRNNDKVFTVWLRSYNDLNGHSVGKLNKNNSVAYRKIERMKFWTGFTLNPGLRRTDVCRKFGLYSDVDILDKSLKGDRGPSESDLAILYAQDGYFGAVTHDANGYVCHLGEGRHISNAWENQYIVFCKNLIRRYINKIRM